MTNEEMDRDLEEARAYLGCTRLTVERCQHESITTSALWVFDNENMPRGMVSNQIGSATRLETPYEKAGYMIRWRCSTLHNGSTANGVYLSSLLDCMGHIMRCTKQPA